MVELTKPTSTSLVEPDLLSLLDLPEPVLDQVILKIHDTIKYNGYLCDLRLVCWRFNENVLHCLAFQVGRRDYRPRHYISCSDVQCDMSFCRDVGRCNWTYARILLQGKMASQNEQNSSLLRHHRALDEALAILRANLHELPGRFEITRLQFDRQDLYKFASRNPIFAAVDGIMLCDAVVLLSEISICRKPFWRWLETFDWPARFWLRILACFVGDIELFNHHSDDSGRQSKTPDGCPTESELLLAVAASRGHEALLRHVLTHTYLQAYSAIGVREACYSGNVRILDILLEAIPTEKIPDVCARSLDSFDASRHLPAGGSAVVERVVEHIVQGHDNILSDRTLKDGLTVLANIGAAPAIRVLLRRFRDRTLWPLLPRVRHPCFSPLYFACINRDQECVRTLLEGEYFENVDLDEARDLCLECLKAAARANSVLIYGDLCTYLDMSLDGSEPRHLSCMEGTAEIMSKKLTSIPDLLTTTDHNEYWKPNIGESALKNAVTRLRVENVEFLLEKGVRPQKPEFWKYFQIEWRYRRAHEQEYQRIQELLRSYGVKELVVTI